MGFEMSLKLSPIAHDTLCHGWRWVVEDHPTLVDRVARVALGQYRHVKRIITGLDVTHPNVSMDIAKNAIQKLQVAVNGDPWQRDGWIFQTISWMAAAQKDDAALLAPPHIFHAHKGFDGIEIEISPDGKSIDAVVIFEDKATTDPRAMIREEVWPTILNLENGERAAELLHETTALLEAHESDLDKIDIQTAIDQIIWKEVRRYRVSITTSTTHESDASRKALFAGYDENAAGDVIRRRAETMHFDDLRAWMNSFANEVIARIKELENV